MHFAHATRSQTWTFLVAMAIVGILIAAVVFVALVSINFNDWYGVLD